MNSGVLYSEATTVHIMSGKAISRAFRALNLLDAALHTLLLRYLLDGSIDEHKLDETEITLLQSRVWPPTSLSDEDIDILDKVHCKLETLKQHLSSRSRTAKLWIQFLHYSENIRQFVLAERMKNWAGHLDALHGMLNLFAATGHTNYAKSARIYLQCMRSLEVTKPDLLKLFVLEGRHAIQRSAHPLNGLWTDLVIEQCLMASLKTQGGLTHGRGLTESMQNTWIFTMHHLSAINDAMLTLTSQRRTSSEQHVDLSQSRRMRDTEDLATITSWLEEHNPFSVASADLMSIVSGLVAKVDDNIDCDEAEMVGAQLQQSMDSVPFNSAKIKRKEQIKTMETLQPGVRIGTKSFHVDPQVLFQRCVTVAQREGTAIESYFEYEMTPVPSALFSDNFMLKNQKSDLSNKIKENLTNHVDEVYQ